MNVPELKEWLIERANEHHLHELQDVAGGTSESRSANRAAKEAYEAVLVRVSESSGHKSEEGDTNSR